MRGDSKPLLKYMDGADTRFIIPVYQRNYDWKKENCKQLLEDLAKVVKEGRPSHFFGSIVSFTEGSESIIIDGQQRLTTVSLMLLALSNLIKDGEIPFEKSYLAEKITDEYLVDKWQPEEKKVKLKPIKDDQSAFLRLFEEEEDYILESKVTQNYLFFYENIPFMGVTADELFEAIKKLIVIDITLESGDNPQLIFESLNSTGLDLSEADKVRNYVLMGLPSATQELYYEKYWNKIEKLTDYEVSDFIRQYLTFKQLKWPNISRVYQAFKDYTALNNDIEAVLSDMLKHARIYQEISQADTCDYECNRILKRFGRLEVGVVNPFLFDAMGRMKDGRMPVSDVRSVLSILESYIFRRLVCEVPTQGLNKTFESLGGEVSKLISSDSEYVDALAYLLLAKSSAARFPDDVEFESKLRERDFYNMRQKNRLYLFDRLENGDGYETTNVSELMLEKEHGLSVEHVMPQSLTEAWKQALGADWERIHSTWKNRIANLTLTAYNGKYSNRPFSEKLSMKDGFKDSPLFLNKWIGLQSEWGEAQLREREDILASRFLELWPLPDTDFLPAQEDGMSYSLDDDFDFTGTKIASFTFMGARQNCKTWKDAAAEVLRQLYELDPASIRRIASMSSYPGNYFRLGGSEEQGWFEVGHECFVCLATSTACKMGLLESVFEAVGISGEELVFEIRLDDDDIRLDLN